MSDSLSDSAGPDRGREPQWGSGRAGPAPEGRAGRGGREACKDNKCKGNGHTNHQQEGHERQAAWSSPGA